MKTIIYYFTGTGNSLAAARKIASILGECELIPIASLREIRWDIFHPEARVGIVCPVHHGGLPRVVAGFAERLVISPAAYVFAIVTAGKAGALALYQLNGILCRKNGRHLDAAWIVKMPGNYPPVIQVPPLYEQSEILKAADAQLAEIARMIRWRVPCPIAFPPISLLIPKVTGSWFNHDISNTDHHFSVTDTCTACGTCEQVCPVNNVALIGGRPSWLHHCESCCACVNFCPEEAICMSVIWEIPGSGRYHHPEISARDMTIQKEGLTGWWYN